MTDLMSHMRIGPALVVALLLATPLSAAGSFLAELEDVPLPPGVTESPGGMLFDSPNGRIIDATATGNLAAHKILSFYAESLPALGWEKTGTNTFRRDNELLRIDVDDANRPTTVRFSVVPQ